MKIAVHNLTTADMAEITLALQQRICRLYPMRNPKRFGGSVRTMLRETIVALRKFRSSKNWEVSE
jgi:hypothetical protein